MAENEKIFNDYLQEISTLWSVIWERKQEEAARKLYGHIDFKEGMKGEWKYGKSKS